MTLFGACAERPLPAQLTRAALPVVRKMMADSESIEEVAVIGNTDITPSESENNIVNTVVLFGFLGNGSRVKIISLLRENFDEI